MTKRTRVKWDITPALDAAKEGGAEGLSLGAKMVLALANEHAPLGSPPDDPHPGQLIGSARTDYDDGVETASVFYDTVYAARVHQNPKWNFGNGRAGKWLYTASLKSRPLLLSVFGDALKVHFSKKRKLPGTVIFDD